MEPKILHENYGTGNVVTEPIVELYRRKGLPRAIAIDVHVATCEMWIRGTQRFVFRLPMKFRYHHVTCRSTLSKCQICHRSHAVLAVGTPTLYARNIVD